MAKFDFNPFTAKFDKVLNKATEISNTPAGNIAATDVQTAINELDTEKASASDLSLYVKRTDAKESDHTIQRTTAGTADTIINDAKGNFDYQAGVLSESSLVGYWKMDGNLNDSKGTNNGYHGNTWNVGKLNNCYVFDGSKIITIPYNANVKGYGAMTVAYWFKTTSSGTEYILSYQNSNSTNKGGFESFHAGGALYFYFSANNVGGSIAYSGGYNDGNWHLAMLVYDGAYFRMYVDNVERGTAVAMTGNVDNANVPFYLGCRNDQIYKYIGSLDEVLVYNKALSLAERTALYNGGAGVEASAETALKAGYHLNESSGTTATDFSSLGNNGTTSAVVDGFSYGTAKYGSNSASLDGTDGLVYINDSSSLDFTTAMTLELWYKPTVLATDKAIATKWTYQTQGSWALQTANGANDELEFYVANSLNENGSNYYRTSNADLQAGTWYHIVVVYNGSQANADRIKIYKNGVILSGSVIGTIATSLQNSTAPINLGFWGGSLSRYNNCVIDEFAVYSSVLSEATILGHYAGNVRSRIRNKNTGTTNCDLYQDGDIYAGSSNSKIMLTPSVTDGASAVAHTLDTGNALSTTGAKLLSLKNNGTEKYYTDKDGKTVQQGSATSPNFVSNIATGTQPIAVTSTTLNTNLNADLLDGNHATAFADSIQTYGELYLAETGVRTANSVTVTNGTITAGDVAATRSINGQYLTVQETGQFLIDFSFTGLSASPGSLIYNGRYAGNAAHEVEILIWNFNTSAWVAINATTKDIPSSATFSTYKFQYPIDSTPYLSGGETRVRIQHTSSAVSSHYIYTDYIAVVEKSVDIVAQGTFYVVKPVTAGLSNDMTVDATNGKITATRAGKYKLIISASFLGTPNSTVYLHPFVNGNEIERIGLKRALNSTGDIGAGSLSGILDLTANDYVELKVTSDLSGAYISFEYLNISLTRIK